MILSDKSLYITYFFDFFEFADEFVNGVDVALVRVFRTFSFQFLLVSVHFHSDRDLAFDHTVFSSTHRDFVYVEFKRFAYDSKDVFKQRWSVEGFDADVEEVFAEAPDDRIGFTVEEVCLEG